MVRIYYITSVLTILHHSYTAHFIRVYFFNFRPVSMEQWWPSGRVLASRLPGSNHSRLGIGVAPTPTYR